MDHDPGAYQRIADDEARGYRSYQIESVEKMTADAARWRKALEEIVALDDADPGFMASPDYYAAIGIAVSIADEALKGAA